MLLWGIVPAFIAGVLTGGRPGNLSAHTLRFESVLLVLLVLVSVAPSIDLPLSDSILVGVAWGIPVLACIIIACLNLGEAGFGLIVVGLTLNLLVVAANTGMPVLTSNVSVVESTGTFAAALEESWLHVPVDLDVRMLILADVIPVPGPRLFRSMLSLGDLLLMIGVGRFVFLGMHRLRASVEPDCLTDGEV